MLHWFCLHIWFLFVIYLISVCYIFDFCLLYIWFSVSNIFDFCLHIWFFSGRVPDLVSVLLAGTQRHSLMLLDSGVCASSTSSSSSSLSSKPPPSSSSITTPSVLSSWLVSCYHFSFSFHQHLQVLLKIPPKPNLEICFHSLFPNFTVASKLASGGPHHCHWHLTFSNSLLVPEVEKKKCCFPMSIAQLALDPCQTGTEEEFFRTLSFMPPLTPWDPMAPLAPPPDPLRPL